MAYGLWLMEIHPENMYKQLISYRQFQIVRFLPQLLILATFLSCEHKKVTADKFLGNYLNSIAPDSITISENEIVSLRGLINVVTIEKLKVDSIGEEMWPVKYEIVYLTTCGIKQEQDKPPVPLHTIFLNKPGRYAWSEEEVHIPMSHFGLSRSRLDSSEGAIWATETKELEVCPLKFELDHWYFITFLDPQIVGAYVFIDNNNHLQQYTIYSGVSPI
jgi:hypothetical protein